MRIYRHDVRDLALSFSLAFDLRRVTQAGLALCWTIFVMVGVTGVLSWRISGGEWMSPEGVTGAWLALTETTWTPLKTLVWGCVVAGWLAGFGYLCAPVLRSTALDIARDERERTSSIPPLNRQAAFAPLLMLLLPALCFVPVLLWSLLTWIPGTAGGLISTLTLPLALVVALCGAAFLAVGLLAAPMMGPTAVVEGRDYLEAVSRPVSYVMQRPGRYFAYWAAKLGVLAASALAGAVVLGLAWGLVAAALWVAGRGDLLPEMITQATASADAGRSVQPAAYGLAVVFWGSVVLLAAWLMVVSLSADMLIYLLMRYQVDGVTFDKICIAEERMEAIKTATETAGEAEEARKRFDAAQTRDAASTA